MSDTTLGPTGDFPLGKLNESDEGGLKLAIGIKDDTVIIEFGTSVTWFGLSSRDARNFAQLILDKAAEIENK